MSTQLSEAQWRAAASPYGSRTFVSAGAGAGKTTTLVQVYRQLLRDHHGADNIDVVTFTNAAAAELKSRLSGLPNPHFIGTFHGMMRHYKYSTTPIASQSMCANLITEARSMFPKDKWPDAKWIANWCAGMDVGLSRPWSYYRRLLQGCGMTDYDGVLHEGQMAFKNHIQDRTVLVDEVQDSGPVEVLYYRMNSGLVIAFGDYRQVLYEWRGADVGSSSIFSEVRKLSRSYRCPKVVCDWVNTFCTSEVDGPLESDKYGWMGTAGFCDMFNGTKPHAVLCRSNRDVEDVIKLAKMRCVDVAEVVDVWDETDEHRRFLAWLNAVANPNDHTIAHLIRVKGGQKAVDEAVAKAAESMTDLVSVTHLDHRSPFHDATDSDRAMFPEIVEADIKASRCKTGADYQALLMEIEQDRMTKVKGDGVVVTTIHKAKGLQWPNVAVYFPNFRPTPENHRLLYVAATRAMDSLLVIDTGQDLPPM